MTGRSLVYNSLSPNGVFEDFHKTMHFTGTDSDLNIFNITGSLLGQATGVFIDAPTGSTVVINVSGQNVSFGGFGFSFRDLNGDGTGLTDRNHVLYNFTQATTFGFDSVSVEGSFLAPLADVNFESGVLQGTLVAKSFTGKGQLNHHLYEGYFPAPAPAPAPTPTPTPIPEPTIGLLTALAVMAGASRRKRS